jgi:hypothetical protein
MGVRRIETRLPEGLQPDDLGEAMAATDGRCALVSFLTSPLPAGHENTYVVFVTDSALAGSVQSYEWVIEEDGAFPSTQKTDVGELTYQPTNAGNITVCARLLDAGDAELEKIELIQEIGPLNPDVEAMIAAALGNPGPGASNLEVLREVANDYFAYYQNLPLKVPEPDDSFKRFVVSFLFAGTLKNSHDDRRNHLNDLAAAMEDNEDALPVVAAKGVGVCEIRLSLLAMNFPASAPLLAWTELPQPADQNALADELLRQKLAALAEHDRIDLINLARFPKTNILQCARLVEALRDKYFPGASFNDVLTGMAGTREHWIVKHFSSGPLTT